MNERMKGASERMNGCGGDWRCKLCEEKGKRHNCPNQRVTEADSHKGSKSTQNISQSINRVKEKGTFGIQLLHSNF